ncbi:MAG TPA: DUF5320 domain-containing protein [Desulfotignum sp.]|nr:DUF5320 domain-containing protein [Desulfotignum sp.]
MPGFNRRGPDNQGPMTGGGRGYCANAAGYAAPYAGSGVQGLGRGRGRRGCRPGFGGRGFGRSAGLPLQTEEFEIKDHLRQRARWLETELAAIQRRLNETDSPSDQ